MAAPYYVRCRLGHPKAFIRKIIELVGLAPGDAVFDLGCGPGTPAIPVASEGMRVRPSVPN
jgi:cyclopropane fatty-acyl-phospholipid synthase-like methyltransferase